MKEQMEKIIKAHNAVVKAIEQYERKSNLQSANEFFSAMVVRHKLACEGAEIVHLARQNGICVKINMQSGEIIVIGGAK